MISTTESLQKGKSPQKKSPPKSVNGVFHRFLSTLLIFILFLSQTIQVSFFDRVDASATAYRDIVSVIIDEDTYKTLKSKVKRYADDIQGYLKATRVSIIIVPADIKPEVIAAHNERLYYEGDGKPGVSTLVGTILIGNVPIPVVHKEGLTMPSLYPYVDFDDKRFLFDDQSGKYKFSREAPESSDVDIWHGVINPSLGETWQKSQDIPKIENFLDKTHEFYTKSGKFAVSPLPPRVFYYDGYNEGASVDMASLYKYILFTQNVENLIYKRWSKYLLTDISTALSQFSQANAGPEDAYAKSLPGLAGVTIGDEGMDPATIATLPDIQTSRPIINYLKKFHEIINKKTLSDIQKYVYNAGRYNNGTKVRVDQGAIQMSLTDEVAIQRLKETNIAIENAIDKKIKDGGYARPIIILDDVEEKSPFVPIDNYNPDRAALPFVKYKNYYFGREAATITEPYQCTIARGSSGAISTYGKSVRVEANAQYDINSTEGHISTLTGDTNELVGIFGSPAFACFTSAGVAKLDSYYGGNSILRISSSMTDPTAFFNTPPSGTNLKGFSLPIFSLGGMKETDRLPDPSINDCMAPTNQYSLLQPHIYEYKINDSWSYNGGTYLCDGAYPDEWNRSGGTCGKQKVTSSPRFTCLTNHTPGISGVSVDSAISNYSSPCTVGAVTVNGSSIYQGGSPCLTGGDAYSGIPPLDSTIYRNYNFHTIPSMMKHVSPTPAEIAAAEVTGATPSLPIDVVRSVEFLSPKGARVKLRYPNFFEAPSTTIADVRNWLKNISDTDWNTIISSDSTSSLSSTESGLSASLGVQSLPATPIDWNTLISDEVIEQVIQARRWLTPDVTPKYKALVETNLSYSHTYSGDVLKNPPKLPDLSNGYDIAYLGLTPFIPGGEKDPNSEDIQAYQYQLGELQGLNFAERDSALDDPGSRATAQCGPPDGVPLFQWPAAIMCWIKTLLPVRITAGSCGGNSIGLTSPSHPSTTPPPNIIRDSQKLRDYYADAKLVYNVKRTSLDKMSTLEIGYRLDRDGSTIIPPTQASIRLDITSVESGRASIALQDFNTYASLSQDEAPYTDKGSQFLLSSYDNLGVVTLRPKLTLILSDNTEFQMTGDPLKVRITDEYLELTPTISGVPTATIDTTETLLVKIEMVPKKGSGTILSPSLPYTIDIYDDISQSLIETGITVSAPSFTLSDKYKDTLGVYRFVIKDALDRVGETTLAVRSGPVSRMEFSPISSTLTKGSTSLGVLKFLDAKGNPISPTLLDIEIKSTGGYLLDTSGKKVDTIGFQTVDSEFLVTYGNENGGDIGLTFTLADPAISLTETIRVIDKPRIKIIRSAPAKVGGDPIDMQLQVVDALTDTPISGFSSIAILDIPLGAGIFSGSELRIKDGVSEPFIFTPGKVAGEHLLSIDIPGISNISEKKFNILPGPAMYIDGVISDATVDFSLRDRYGNLSDGKDYAGTIKRNQLPESPTSFVGGKLSIPRASGYWRVDVPDIGNNTITYTDSENTQTPAGVYTNTGITKTLKGITYYNLYVQDQVGKYNFLPDYNARYTVLAGDTFLSEGSQILYDTTPGSSQSLAVSTLLSSPYSQDVLFSLFPGGGWTIGEPSDMAIETRISARGKYLHLSVNDSASQTQLAQVAYPLVGLPLSTCTESGSESNLCGNTDQKPGIIFALFPESDYRLEQGGSSMSILEGSTPLLSYTDAQGLTLTPGVELIPRPEYSAGRLIADIEINNEAIGRIILGLPEGQGVDIGSTNNPVNRLTLDSAHAYSRKDIYNTIFSPTLRGYSIFRDTSTFLLDERVIGPSPTESIGSIRENPGVGWQGSNRSLLSFAAGDTVGEATRWFHTYNLINLGDPVAHVDKGAPGTQTEGVDRTIGTEIASGIEEINRIV